MKLKLTPQFIAEGLLCPNDKKQIEFVCDGGSGLYILVSRVSPGTGTYYLRYKNSTGKTSHRKIGRSNDITLSQARSAVTTMRAEITLGADPQAKVREQRKEMTYGSFMENHYLPYIEPRKRVAIQYKRLYESKLKSEFGDVKVNALSKRRVQAFHSRLLDEGCSKPYANRFLQLIKSSINVGINVMEVIDVKNPAVGVPLFDEESRERYLDENELGRLLPILISAEGHLVVPGRIVRFLLATGLRIGECFHCRWEHIDLENRSMSIPAANAKSKRHDSIPLNAAAIEVLNQCDRSSPHPFANPTTGKPYVSIKKSFKSMMVHADLEGVTAHTCRHTAASLMINGGQSLYSVQRILRHSSSKVTEKYAHLSTRSLQEASDTISRQLLAASLSDDRR